jgi:hypothetical protein
MESVLTGLVFSLVHSEYICSRYIFSLFHLRNWLWSNLPSDMWHGKTAASKRAWTDLMLRSSYPLNLSEWNANEIRR